jgi:single-strand DNA-binding protein
MNGIHVALQGRLPRDADPLKYLPNGNALVGFSVAVEDAKRSADAPSDWCKITIWGQQAEQLGDRLVKGTEVYIEGRLKLEQWTGQNGTQRSALAVSAWKCEVLGAIGKRAPRDSCRPTGWRQAGTGSAYGAAV